MSRASLRDTTEQVVMAPMTLLFECGWVTYGLDLAQEAGPTVHEIMEWLHESYDNVTRHDRHTITALALYDWHFTEDGSDVEDCPSHVCVTLVFPADVSEATLEAPVSTRPARQS